MKFLAYTTALSSLMFAGSVLAQSKPPGAVPEPGVWALMGAGFIALAARHFLKK